jgi:3-(methylthio)propionyl---CoA ligase
MATRKPRASKSRARRAAPKVRAKAPKQPLKKGPKRVKLRAPKKAPAAPSAVKRVTPRAKGAGAPASRAKPAPLARRLAHHRQALPQPRPAPGHARPKPPPASANGYERDLARNPANFQALTPLSFLARAARIEPDRVAIIHGRARTTYRDFSMRSCALASALTRAGIGKNDTVSALLANTPAMLEAHHGVPMAGAVLNAINTRLDPSSIAFMLDHAEAKVFLVDREFAGAANAALGLARVRPLVILYDDPEFPQTGTIAGAADYEAFVASGDPEFAWSPPDDEWDAISLNYTSGTTGNPKGVVCHHRGAALMGYSNILACRMPEHPVYLWTLPMFHCNGWCFPWTLALVAGTHVCLRWMRAREMYSAIAEHGVTHLSGAPVVMATLLNAEPEERRAFSQTVNFVHAAAPPPEAVLMAMLDAGFALTHVYGLTETYGPATVNVWHQEWNALSRSEQGAKRIRQGVPYAALEQLAVLDPATLDPVPADGRTLGEVMFRGNIVMKGYLKNPKATEDAFAGGWFHSGDLGVMHADGYVQLKDRSKDIIISGGENISSIEVEETLYRHPAVLFAAVVAQPDEKWGERPCAFIELRPGRSAGEGEILEFCRANLAHFKCPKSVVFCELPKTTTGKIQKFRLREHARSLS